MNFSQRDRAGRASDSRRIRRTWNFQPTLERLDQRLALTSLTASLVDPGALAIALPLRVEAVIPHRNPYADTPLVLDPANSPAFSIHFNHPIDISLSTAGDFRLDRIEADGSTTRLALPGLQYLEDGDPSAPTSNSLILSFISPLAPGHYRLFLSATNLLQGQLNPGATPGDQLIDEFAMGTQAASEMPVRSLGKITRSITTTTLPMVNNDLQASLNELDLPAGANWTIAPSFGGADPDHFRFVLLDSEMRLILSTTGSNLLGLNQGLHSGRFYLQVYQTTSIAGLSNPTIPLIVTGTMAQPETEPILHVTSFNLNGSDLNADTLLIDLTGIDVESAFFDSSQSAFTLTDENGQSWAVKPLAYDATTGQLTLSLAGYLPTGHYTLMAVTASQAGSAASIRNLGSFDNVWHDLPADNLGTIFPDGQEMSGQHPTIVSPGQSVTQRFAVIKTQRYQVVLSNPNFSGKLIHLTKDATGRSSSLILDDDFAKDFGLEPGTYQIVATNNTPISQLVSFAVTINRTLPVSLSSGGVGQLPATLSQGGLVANSPSPAVSQNFARPYLELTPGFEVTSVLKSATGPALRIPRGSGDRAEAFASFHSSAPLQASLGPLSNPASFTRAATPPTHWSSISDSLAGAVHSSVFLNTIAPNMTVKPGLKRQPFPAESPHQPSPRPGPVSDRSPLDRRADLNSLVANDLPRMGQSDMDFLVSSEPETAEVSAMNQAHPPTLLARRLSTNRVKLFTGPEADAADPTNELANLTSPIGIIVVTCGILRHIKSTRIRASLPGRQFFARIWRLGANWLGGHHSPLGRVGKTRSSNRVNFTRGFE